MKTKHNCYYVTRVLPKIEFVKVHLKIWILADVYADKYFISDHISNTNKIKFTKFTKGFIFIRPKLLHCLRDLLSVANLC